jgi:Ca-activated chloride channel family protein
MTTLTHEYLSHEVGRAGAPVLRSVKARGSVSGLLFELTVEQHYVNASDGNIEAVYTFPVPWRAVLLGVELILGDRVLRGTVAAKADGERRYERALADGDSAVMVERARDGMYTVSVGNLLPGEQAVVRFRYAQLLSFAQGQVRLVVPTVIAPRYGDPCAAGLQPHQVPATDLHADYPFALDITLQGDLAAATLGSPSHRVTVRHAGDRVTVALAAGARLDRDFVLLADGLTGRSVSALGRDGDGYVALASFCPDDTDAPGDGPLNLKILVDCSGSMNGERISAARRGLHEVLGHLKYTDSFSFSCFGSEVRHFSQSLMAATPRAVRKAAGWVAETVADMGGTETGAALQSTFALARPFPADVLLITDGDVWEADALVASAADAGQRVFAVGIGSAPASSLLHALAARTGGACDFVDTDAQVEGAILRTFRRMRQPAVHDVTVAWDGTPVWQTAPERVVLGNETQHHFAGFADRAPVDAVLRWRGAAGEGACEEAVTVGGDADIGDTLARVAAAMRMDGADPAEGHALALRYGLVSATTNLVLVHERGADVKPENLPALRTVAHSLPAGWGGLGSCPASPLKMPAVWRREPAAGTLRVTQEVELYDIPEFLRKKVEPASEYLYRDGLRRLADRLAPAAARGGLADAMPGSLDELAAELPEPLADELRSMEEAGFPEPAVLRAFVLALVGLAYPDSTMQRLRNFLRQRGPGSMAAADSELRRRVDALAQRAWHARPTDAGTNAIPAWLRKAAD